MDRAIERVARVLELLELREHEADAVPRDRLLGLEGEHLAIRLEAELQPLSAKEQQREVEPRLHEVRLRRQRGAEGVHRALRLAGVVLRDAEVVVRDRVRRIDLERATIARRGRGVLPLLVQRHTALAPELGRILLREQDLVVQLDRRRRILLEQMHLGHRLPNEILILVTVEREPVFLQRLGVVALLPEGEAEIVVREVAVRRQLERGRAALLPLGNELVVARGVVAIDREIRLRARERRVELDRALRRHARLLVPAEIAEHEADQVVRVGVLRGRARSSDAAR